MAKHTHTQASSHGVELQDATRVSKQMTPSRLGRAVCVNLHFSHQRQAGLQWSETEGLGSAGENGWRQVGKGGQQVHRTERKVGGCGQSH